MRIYRAELEFIKKITTTLNCGVNINIYGNIQHQVALFKNDNSSVSIYIDKDGITIKSDLFDAFLRNYLGFNKPEIDSLIWAGEIFLNYVTVEYQGTTYTEHYKLFNRLFCDLAKSLRTQTLNVVYNTKNHIYTGLFFTSNQELYVEYILRKVNGTPEKILVNHEDLKTLESRVREMIYLGFSPNYETPTPISYKQQLCKYAKESRCVFRIRN